MHSVFCRVLLVNQLDITERSYTPPNIWRRPRGKVSLPCSSSCPFLPRDAMRKRGLCCRPVSVCPSDRPSLSLSAAVICVYLSCCCINKLLLLLLLQPCGYNTPTWQTDGLSCWCIASTWLKKKKKKKFVYATTTQIHTNDSSRQTKWIIQRLK